jgi:hypothetical protein
VGVYPVKSSNDAHWLTGLWSTQAKVESIVLKVTRHRGSDSCVVNDPLGEPDRTPLYVGLLSKWGSMDGDMFSPHFIGGLLFGESDRYK